MRRQVGVAPSAATDTATKAYADAFGFKGYTPPPGQFQNPDHHLGGSTTGTPNNQAIYFEPFTIGPAGLAINQVGVDCTTAAVAGAGTITTTLGLYIDNGSGGYPLLTAGGLLASGTFAATVGTVGITVSLTLAPGRYWGAFLYVTTGSITTAPQFMAIAANGVALWGSKPGAVSRTLYLTGQSSLPTTTQTLATQSGSTAPAIGLKAA